MRFVECTVYFSDVIGNISTTKVYNDRATVGFDTSQVGFDRATVCYVRPEVGFAGATVSFVMTTVRLEMYEVRFDNANFEERKELRT